VARFPGSVEPVGEALADGTTLFCVATDPRVRRFLSGRGARLLSEIDLSYENVPVDPLSPTYVHHCFEVSELLYIGVGAAGVVLVMTVSHRPGPSLTRHAEGGFEAAGVRNNLHELDLVSGYRLGYDATLDRVYILGVVQKHRSTGRDVLDHAMRCAADAMRPPTGSNRISVWRLCALNPKLVAVYARYGFVPTALHNGGYVCDSEPDVRPMVDMAVCVTSEFKNTAQDLVRTRHEIGRRLRVDTAPPSLDAWAGEQRGSRRARLAARCGLHVAYARAWSQRTDPAFALVRPYTLPFRLATVDAARTSEWTPCTAPGDAVAVVSSRIVPPTGTRRRRVRR